MKVDRFWSGRLPHRSRSRSSGPGILRLLECGALAPLSKAALERRIPKGPEIHPWQSRYGNERGFGLAFGVRGYRPAFKAALQRRIPKGPGAGWLWQGLQGLRIGDTPMGTGGNASCTL